MSISGLTISNGLLSSINGSTTANDLSGAGIVIRGGTVALNNCILNANSAGNAQAPASGGAIYNVGTLNMTGCNVTGNSVKGQSSGLYNHFAATVTVSNSTFNFNTSTETGGAIGNFGTMTIINTTITGNTAASGGGGIESGFENGDSKLTLINDTINNNNTSGGNGGGIEFTKSVVLQNTIIAKNGAPSARDVFTSDGATTVTSQGHNLIGSIDGSGGGWIASDLTGTNAQPLEPKLDTLKNNGGPAPTIALLAGSPAIDAGDDSVLGAPVSLTSDERGFPRPIGSHVDIGALEQDAAQTSNFSVVNTTLDDSDGACGQTRCTLRDALETANGGGTKFIKFAANVTGTITLNGTELVISQGLRIDGPGARILSVDAHLASRVLNITAPSGAFLTISGLTFTGGQLFGAAGVPQGGGIRNSATTSIGSCTISGSSAVGDAGQDAQGGGIYNSGTLALQGCTLRGNSALGGSFPTNGNSVATGGTGSGGGVFNGGDLLLENCTFSANTAQGGRGGHNPLLGSGHGGNGGWGLGGAVADTKTLTLRNCTLSANTAVGGLGGTGKTNGVDGAGQGGGIYRTNATTSQLGNMLIAGNTGANGGPDVFGQFTSEGFNLVGKADNSTGFTASDKTGTVANPLDPKLSPLADNGGSTDTMALLPGSPAIDAGGPRVKGRGERKKGGLRGARCYRVTFCRRACLHQLLHLHLHLHLHQRQPSLPCWPTSRPGYWWEQATMSSLAALS